MGRYHKLLFAVIGVVLTVIIFTGEEIEASSKWGDFDVRTDLSEGVTPEKVRERFDKNGYKNSAYYGDIEYVFEEGKRYGINPAFVIAKMNLESTWGTSSMARNSNNYGGIKTTESFQTAKDGIAKQFDLLDKYVKGTLGAANGKKMVTMQEILNVYCPTSDGCNHSNYIASVGSMMETFGQTMDGSLMDGTASEEELEETQKDVKDKNGNPVPLGTEIYEMRPEVFNNVGVKTGENYVGQEKVNWFNRFSESSMKWLLRVGWVLSFGLMLYVTMYIMAYAVLPRGTRLEKFFSEQMMDAGEEANTQGFKGLIDLLKRGVVALALMFLFGTGVYITIMSFILTGLERLTRWIL